MLAFKIVPEILRTRASSILENMFHGVCNTRNCLNEFTGDRVSQSVDMAANIRMNLLI